MTDVVGKARYICNSATSLPARTLIHQVLYFCPDEVGIPSGPEDTWVSQGCAIKAADDIIWGPNTDTYTRYVAWEQAQTGWYSHCAVYVEDHGDHQDSAAAVHPLPAFLVPAATPALPCGALPQRAADSGTPIPDPCLKG